MTDQKTTVVLVHGAFADSSSWNGVTEAGAQNDAVVGLVYVDAFVPDHGQSALEPPAAPSATRSPRTRSPTEAWTW
jgi:hypothetical protein